MKNKEISPKMILFVIIMSSLVLFGLISFFVKGLPTGHVIHAELIYEGNSVGLEMNPPYSPLELIIIIPLGILILALSYSVIKKANNKNK